MKVLASEAGPMNEVSPVNGSIQRASMSRSLAERARDVASQAARHAADHDDDGAFPDEDIGALQHAGLLMAPVPHR